MSLPSAYWTLIGEITLVLMGVLVAVIIFILKDRKNLQDYSLYLKELIKKLKQKIKEYEEQESQERVQELIRGMIDHVRTEYEAQAQVQGDIDHSLEQGLDSKPSVEQFILISGFQMLSAELTALENSNEPAVAWEKVKSELMPLIQNFLQPVLAAQSSEQSGGDTDNIQHIQEQLAEAQQRIDNLQQFKQLYFNLQKNMAEQIAELEPLNQKIVDLVQGSENQAAIMAITEKNKTHYISMGQLLGMDKEQHHDSVSDSMDYSDVLISERKNEIKRLKSQISQQFEEIWKLQNSLSGQSGAAPDPQALQAGVDTFSRQLKDAELCIETMDMEIQTLTSEINRLEKQLEQQQGGSEADSGLAQQERDDMIARFAQESKEMMSCITGLEDSTQEQSETIKKLEADYAELEAKYLKLVN